MTMGYLEIHYEPECTDSVLTCIGLGYGKFLSDLAFTADSEYKQDDDYPETLFHERMSELLEDLAEDYLEMPLLFSVELPAHMANLLGCFYAICFLSWTGSISDRYAVNTRLTRISPENAFQEIPTVS